MGHNYYTSLAKQTNQPNKLYIDGTELICIYSTRFSFFLEF